MKWPVSFEVYEAALREMREQLVAADARYYDLMAKYHELKASGASAAVPVAPREPDPVTHAIIAKARGNPALFRHYQTFVAERRAMSQNDESIAREILQGVEDDIGAALL